MKRDKVISIRVDEETYKLWKELVRMEKSYGKMAWYIFKEMLNDYVRKRKYGGLRL